MRRNRVAPWMPEASFQSPAIPAPYRLRPRNGRAKSIYLTDSALEQLKTCASMLGRSHSSMASKIIEKFAPVVLKDKREWGDYK
jgi:hypothetical protein